MGAVDKGGRVSGIRKQAGWKPMTKGMVRKQRPTKTPAQRSDWYRGAGPLRCGGELWEWGGASRWGM